MCCAWPASVEEPFRRFRVDLPTCTSINNHPDKYSSPVHSRRDFHRCTAAHLAAIRLHHHGIWLSSCCNNRMQPTLLDSRSNDTFSVSGAWWLAEQTCSVYFKRFNPRPCGGDPALGIAPAALKQHPSLMKCAENGCPGVKCQKDPPRCRQLVLLPGPRRLPDLPNASEYRSRNNNNTYSLPPPVHLASTTATTCPVENPQLALSYLNGQKRPHSMLRGLFEGCKQDSRCDPQS